MTQPIKKKTPKFEKHTMNFRIGDFDKMEELFPAKGPSVAIRETIASFIDSVYEAAPTQTVTTNVKDLTDE